MSEIPSQIPSSDPPDSGGSFYRALLLLATAVLVILGIFASEHWKRNPAGSTLAPVNPPDPARPDVEIIPDTPFADVTSESGVTFVHFNGAAGEKLLPETMGAGVAIFDANHDGLQDLLFANGADWSWTQARKASVPTPELWLNQGGMTFSNSTVSSGLAFSMQGTGVAVGDYDNDGKTDVFLSGVGTLRLLRNIGNGRFEDVTAGSGLHLGVEDWASSAAFLDYDNDGDLDLFACLYVRWSREIDISVDYRLVGVGRAYGPPNNFPGNYPRLWQNLGDGRFRDVSVQAGLRMLNKATGEPVAKSLGVSPVDLDRDGWMDLVVANDTVQNFVFHNERNGTFKEIGAASGIAFDSYGSPRGAMGIDSARMQEDDQLAIAIGNFANEMTALYVAQRDPLMFSDEAIGQGIGAASRLSLTFGVFFFDYDLDGWLDFLTTNGHIEQEISRIQKSQNYAQPAKLYWNSRGRGGVGAFVPVPYEKVGTPLAKPLVGRGSAFGDLDADGDLDVVMTQAAGLPVILRNDQSLGHNWIRVRLEGRQSNRDAIGAWVTVRLPGRTMHRQVMPCRGYLSSSELPVTIGLGRESAIREVTVAWPGFPGKATTHPVALNTLTVIHQPEM